MALRGETATPLHVWAGSALEMIVDADDAAYDGYPYRVRIGLHNVADVPVYNPSVELLPGLRQLHLRARSDPRAGHRRHRTRATPSGPATSS